MINPPCGSGPGSLGARVALVVAADRTPGDGALAATLLSRDRGWGRGGGEVGGSAPGRAAGAATGPLGRARPPPPLRCVHQARQSVFVTFPLALTPFKRDEAASLAGTRIPGDRGTAALVSSL